MPDPNPPPIDWATATEAQLRDAEVPWFKTPDDLMAFIQTLTTRDHDYGTVCYATSCAAIAVFRYVAGVQGITGFQASCADLDFLRRIRGWKKGFKILNYEDLLYPQLSDQVTASPTSLLEDPGTRKTIRAEAKRLIADREGSTTHPAVLAHWKKMAALPVLPGEATKEHPRAER